MPVREIQLDDATGELLSKVFNAPDDDEALLSAVGEVDPLDFRKFLAEIGELDNPDGLRLLRAIEAKHGISPKISSAEPLRTFISESAHRTHRSTSPLYLDESLKSSQSSRDYHPIAAHAFFPQRRYMLVLIPFVIGVMGSLYLYLRPPKLSPEVTAAIKSLDERVQTMPDLFDAPSPRLQSEYLARFQDRSFERALLSTLYESRAVLPDPTLKRAALLAFALEDYQHASAFVRTGLSKSYDDKRLLATRGLIEYGQSLYPQALSSFQQSASSEADVNENFKAIVTGNEGLARWDLGQTNAAEESLKQSIASSTIREQQIYLLLTQADLYADYGQAEKALEISRSARNQIGTQVDSEKARINEGHVLNLRARLAFFRGDIKEARQEIHAAIKMHQGDASILELALDKDVLGAIQQQTGQYKEAIATLMESAQTYERTGYLRGQSDNLLKQSRVFIDVNDYGKAEDLIGRARSNFAQLNYQRGLGESEALIGILVIRRANHQYIEQFHKNTTTKQKNDASDEYFRQTKAAIPHFESAFKIFQDIGYQRGIADAQDNLAFNLALVKEKLSKDEAEFAGQNASAAARTYEAIGDKGGEASAYGHWGIVLRKTDEYDAAIAQHERALEISRQIEFKVGIGRQLLGLGRAYYDQAYYLKDQNSMRKAVDYFLAARKVLTEAAPAGQDELKAVNAFLKHIASGSRR